MGNPKRNIRNALLAKVHIAKKELGLDDELYRAILLDEFGVESAGDLTVGELGALVERFESRGWKPRAVSGKHDGGQVEALKERAGQLLLRTDLTPARFRKLLFKVCGVEDLRWAEDAHTLKRLLAILKTIGEA